MPPANITERACDAISSKQIDGFISMYLSVDLVDWSSVSKIRPSKKGVLNTLISCLICINGDFIVVISFAFVSFCLATLPGVQLLLGLEFSLVSDSSILLYFSLKPINFKSIKFTPNINENIKVNAQKSIISTRLKSNRVVKGLIATHLIDRIE